MRLSRRAALRAAPALALLGHGLPVLAERPERPQLSLAVGGKTALCYLPLTVAEQLKFFAAEGLEVELQDHASGARAEHALIQGQADLAAGAFEHTIVLRQRGYSARAFVFLGRAPQLVFGVSQRTLREFLHPVQLRGRRIGVSAPESYSHWFARMALTRAGVAPAEVEFVAVGTSTAAVAALREGRIDAIVNFDPVISQLEAHGDIRLLWDTRTLRGTQELFGGPMPGGSVYAPQDFVLRHPRTVQAMANALVRALKWLQTASPSDIVRAVPEAYMHGDRAIYLAAFEKSREALSPDGMGIERAIQNAHAAAAQFGLQQQPAVRPPAPGATYTNEFVLRARQRVQAMLWAGGGGGLRI